MKASEVMTRHVATCSTGDSAADAARVMWDHDCGVVPVVESGRVRGIVTDRDLLMASQIQGRDLHHLRLESLVPGPVTTCRDDEDVNSVLATMASRQIRRMPVVDRNGLLVGIVSLNDLSIRSLGDRGLMIGVAETLAAVSRHRQPAAARA